MKFKIISFDEIKAYFYKTPLYLAIEKENIEIIKLLLNKENVDVNLNKTESSKFGNKKIIKSNVIYHSLIFLKNTNAQFAC